MVLYHLGEEAEQYSPLCAQKRELQVTPTTTPPLPGPGEAAEPSGLGTHHYIALRASPGLAACMGGRDGFSILRWHSFYFLL